MAVGRLRWQEAGWEGKSRLKWQEAGWGAVPAQGTQGHTRHPHVLHQLPTTSKGTPG